MVSKPSNCPPLPDEKTNRPLSKQLMIILYKKKEVALRKTAGEGGGSSESLSFSFVLLLLDFVAINDILTVSKCILAGTSKYIYVALSINGYLPAEPPI